MSARWSLGARSHRAIRDSPGPHPREAIRPAPTGDSIPRDCGARRPAFPGSPSSASPRGRPSRPTDRSVQDPIEYFATEQARAALAVRTGPACRSARSLIRAASHRHSEVMSMSPDARSPCAPGLLLAACAAAGSAAAQDRAPASADAPAPPPRPADQARRAPGRSGGAKARLTASGWAVSRSSRAAASSSTSFATSSRSTTRTHSTRTIPIGARERTNSNLIAKESRLILDIRGQVDDHELRMYIEGDFYGTGSAFRLRHAYGTWRGLLAGQYWSTFVDETTCRGRSTSSRRRRLRRSVRRSWDTRTS